MFILPQISVKCVYEGSIVNMFVLVQVMVGTEQAAHFIWNSDDQVKWIYLHISNISYTLIGNKIIDHSDIVEKSPVAAAPTTSSFSS